MSEVGSAELAEADPEHDAESCGDTGEMASSLKALGNSSVESEATTAPAATHRSSERCLRHAG